MILITRKEDWSYGSLVSTCCKLVIIPLTSYTSKKIDPSPADFYLCIKQPTTLIKKPKFIL